MSDENKCFSRPKVRFSRSADSPTDTETVGAFAKPKIRSIVKFRPSIKILKPPSSLNNDELSLSHEETNLRNSVGDSPNDHRLCPPKTSSRSAPCLTEIVLSPENHTSKPKCLSDRGEISKSAIKSPKSNSVEKKKESLTKSTLSEKSFKPKSKDTNSECGVSQTKLSENRLGKENIAESRDSKKVVAKSRESHKNPTKTRESKKNVVETRESKNNVVETRQSKKNVAESRDSKENIPRAPRNSPKSQSTEVTKIASSKSSSSSSNLKKTETTSKKTGKVIPKNIKSKPAPIGLMPCMKSAKNRTKSAPVKKTILSDATAIPSQVYVGPGVVRPRSLDEETRPGQRPLRSRSEILSGDKLARPEYNSIVHTIKKLRDAREVRIAEDLEHLPSVYQRLVNGKVSSALDFGANEAIYRDLVDLSIDEKQLPSRLMRSKDPEPRQRDLVPKLSDFFVPRNDEEYRRAVLIRPPSPRVLDTWNPYKVSDRIFSWKESLDHDH